MMQVKPHVKLSRADMERLRDRLSGRTDDDRRREHQAFVAALEEMRAIQQRLLGWTRRPR